MTTHFHVTSSRNRASIEAHGLDWTYMGAARGIAGSDEPEAAGIFLVDDRDDVDWFVGMNNTGGPVDVWSVEGVDSASLVESGTGYRYLPATIPVSALTLVDRDIAERPFG